MLRLLQQRTKLSGKIGAMKRRHGAVIYVPEREHELLARLTRLGHDALPARAIAALYREILSSSRAAQGQTPIGLLQASAEVVLPAARARFGACDRFAPMKNWGALAHGLDAGKLSLALLTGNELVEVLKTPRWQSQFVSRFAVVGDLTAGASGKSRADRIFIVTPRGEGQSKKAGRMAILIECKLTLNAIKSLFHAMSEITPQAELIDPPAPGAKPASAVAVLGSEKPFETRHAMLRLKTAADKRGMGIVILGMYPATEVYGG